MANHVWPNEDQQKRVQDTRLEIAWRRKRISLAIGQCLIGWNEMSKTTPNLSHGCGVFAVCFSGADDGDRRTAEKQ